MADELVELDVAILDVLDEAFLAGFHGTVLTGLGGDGSVWAEHGDAGVCLEGERQAEGGAEDGPVFGGLEFDGEIIFY